MYILNVSMSVNEVIFPFINLVYHKYTNANIGLC